MYVDETEEQLDDLVETMLELEERPDDESSLATAFRLLHSMKGAAGMMGYDQITALTHHLETRFERLRSGRIELDRVTMNLTLRCIDFLRDCNDQLRGDGNLATPDELLQELRELEDKTEQRLEAEASGQAKSVEPPETTDAVVSETSTAAPPTKTASGAVTESATESATENTQPADVTLGTHYHLVAHIDTAIVLKETIARSVAAAMDDIGDVKATRPELEALYECEDLSVFDVIVFTELSPQQVLQAGWVDGVGDIEVRIPQDNDSPPLATTFTTDSKSPQADEDGKDVPEEDSAEVPTAESETETAQPTRQPSIKADQDNPSQPNASPDSPPQEEPPVGPKRIAPTGKPNETMRVDIDRLDHLMSLAGELVVNRAQFVQVASDLGTGLRKSSTNDTARQLQELLTSAIESLRSENDAADQADRTAAIAELESGLRLLSHHEAVVEENRRSFGQLDEAIDQLSRVSNSLQRGVLGTRMVPVAPLFNRFKRVVRDLSLDRGKQITLLLDGENTELDKRMIDALGDPLVHLVRNSVDHGMESPDDRARLGKPREGTITLSAQHRGNHVYIQIQDDGGGIDDQKIRKRLVDRNLLSPTEAAALSRQQAIEYVWHPGFSTAEKVTDISGRGVGMDIVKSSIADLGGTIETESETGVGTTFTLKLPLTLAIISSLLVEIRRIVFAIPKDDVAEIVQMRQGDLIDIGGRQTFEVRGEYLPLICIDDLFQWNSAIEQSDPCRESSGESSRKSSSQTDHVPTNLPESAEPQDVLNLQEVVVLQSGDQRMGLKVDRSIGSQDVVIKSLAENFVSIHGLAGASILGNGSVALMLDVASLFKLAMHSNSDQ